MGMTDFGYTGVYGGDRAIRNMTLDDLRKAVPSAFSEKPSDVMSDKYGYIPSYPLIEHMLSNGYQATAAYESKTRIDEKRGYTKHCVRFVNADMKLPEVNDTYEAQVFTNSHDGSSSFQFRGGVYVVACKNGLIRCVSMEDIVRIQHRGDVIAKLHQAMPRLHESLKATANDIQDFAVIKLDSDERSAFARAAAELRWQPEEKEDEPGVVVSTVPINTEMLLVPVRQSDAEMKQSLWGTLNIVQEHIMQGGVQGRAETGRRMTTRAVTSVDNDIRINTALWNLAAGMRDYKRSA